MPMRLLRCVAPTAARTLRLRPTNTSCDSLRGESRVEAFGSNRLLAIPLNLLGKNAKTRWGEPAGLELYGHLAVTDSMEAAS